MINLPIDMIPNVCCTWSGQTMHTLWQNSTPSALKESVCQLVPSSMCYPGKVRRTSRMAGAKVEKVLKTLTSIRLWSDWVSETEISLQELFTLQPVPLPDFVYLKIKHIFFWLNFLPNNLVSLSSISLGSSPFLFSWFISLLGFMKYLLASPFFLFPYLLPSLGLHHFWSG